MSRTKLIDVYGITKVCRAVRDNDGHLQMYERRGLMAEDGAPITLLGAASATIKVHDIPIHRIRTPDGDRFVAIEPDLKALLELPFEERVSYAEQRCRVAIDRAHAKADRADRMRSDMLAMPWWRRAMFVLRRRNLETQ